MPGGPVRVIEIKGPGVRDQVGLECDTFMTKEGQFLKLLYYKYRMLKWLAVSIPSRRFRLQIQVIVAVF